uniref:Cyclin N-terminal domain-containing protein n=1 Tax=Arcella intermedia TaxID=1963864 RepID=A0A6B2LJT0_9EUKA
MDLLRKRFSTSSMSTQCLDTERTIEGIAVGIHRCLRMEHSNTNNEVIFDERFHSFSGKDKRKCSYSFKAILEFLMKIEKQLQLPCEVYTIAIIYMDRVATHSGVFLKDVNWKRIFLAALIVSAKFMLDEKVENCDFVFIIPDIKDINNLERRFLCHLQFDLYVESSYYHLYYFSANSMVSYS